MALSPPRVKGSRGRSSGVRVRPSRVLRSGQKGRGGARLFSGSDAWRWWAGLRSWSACLAQVCLQRPESTQRRPDMSGRRCWWRAMRNSALIGLPDCCRRRPAVSPWGRNEAWHSITAVEQSAVPSPNLRFLWRAAIRVQTRLCRTDLVTAASRRVGGGGRTSEWGLADAQRSSRPCL